MWAGIASVVMGAGVWAMHFIGMLSLNLPCGVYYEPLTTMLSIIPGILASGVALSIWQSSRRGQKPPVLLSSVLLGSGIGAMHYTGMTAMKLPGFIGYDIKLFALSMVVAVLLAYFALSIKARHARNWKSEVPGAILMGGAISGMHYTAMSASYFVRADVVDFPASVLGTHYLATTVLIVTGFVIMLAIAVSAAYRNAEIAEELSKSEERWKFALESGGEGVWDWDVPSGRVMFSKFWKEMLGYDEDEIEIKEWPTRVHPEDKQRVMQEIEAHFAGLTPTFQSEFRLQGKNGDWKWILSRGMMVSRNADGLPLRMVGTHTDITERKKSEEAVQLASLVYENSSEAMMVMNLEGVIITVNPAFAALTGYPAAEVIDKHANFLSSSQHDQAFHDDLWETVRTTGRWQGELWSRPKNGGIYAEWLSISTIYNDDGTPHRRVGLFSDITKKKEFEELIWKEANFDLLTGLPNRRMFLNKLEEEIKKAKREDAPLTLMFIDLDRFKEVNDTLGHDMGDLLLKEAGHRIRACVRETDTVARLGGDEFTVVLSGQSEQNNIARVYNKILHKLAEPFFLKNEAAYVSASIGITIFPADADAIEQLLKNADQAMYAAKNQGRNRYCYFTSAMQEAAQSRMRLANDLRTALAEKQFFLVYQPIVELATGSIHKAEALVRWQHPEQGLVNPAEFIPVAEDTGLIVELGDWVFKEAAIQLKRFRTHFDPDFEISVNKSAVQCHAHGNIHLNWAAYLQEMKLPGHSVTVEITESILLDSQLDVIDRLNGLRSAGMQISLDDFGTGYSSLSYLKKFDIDYLKIDRSFINNLKKGSDDHALCEAIIVMAHRLGMKVVAEGVETVDQCDLLAEAGCDFAQGYLFSKPVPAVTLEKMLELPVFYIA